MARRGGRFLAGVSPVSRDQTSSGGSATSTAPLLSGNRGHRATTQQKCRRAVSTQHRYCTTRQNATNSCMPSAGTIISSSSWAPAAGWALTPAAPVEERTASRRQAPPARRQLKNQQRNRHRPQAPRHYYLAEMHDGTTTIRLLQPEPLRGVLQSRLQPVGELPPARSRRNDAQNETDTAAGGAICSSPRAASPRGCLLQPAAAPRRPPQHKAIGRRRALPLPLSTQQFTLPRASTRTAARPAC